MVLVTTPAVNETINRCHGRCCCGPVRYLLDECDGSEPWKCYWRIQNIGLAGQVVDKNKSAWSMAGGRMKPALHTIAGGQQRQDVLMFKLKSYPPPWTVKVAVQFSDLTALAGIGTNFIIRILNQRFTWQGISGNAWRLFPNGLGAGSAMDTATGTFVNAGNSLTIEATCDTSRVITLSGKLDGATPTIVSGPAMPQVFTATESALNSLTALEYWPVRITFNGEGYIDYIEASVKPSI